MFSLIDTLEEIDGHVSVITETWFKKSAELDEALRDAQDVTGYGFIRKDRWQSTGEETRGGGVAIVYKKSNFEMTELKIAGKHEIVASLGRRTGQKRKLITIGAYIQPAADAETSKDFLETISNAIRRFKAKYCSPYFIIAGDVNKRKIAAELREFVDIKLVKTGPTRGRHTLDLVFTNFPEYVHEYGKLPALFNQEGVASDHEAVHLYAKIPRVPDYTIQRYSYVKQTDEGDALLAEYFKTIDWTRVTSKVDSSAMVEELHVIFEQGISNSYKTISTTRKSNQPQWINQKIIDLIAQRRADFRREGRSDTWKKIRKKTRSIIKRRKAFFNKQKRDKMPAADSRSFHKCVKSFVSDEKAKQWSPTSMFPQLDEQ